MPEPLTMNGVTHAAVRRDLQRLHGQLTRVVVERHLAHEEDELEPLTAPHLEGEAWRAAEKRLRKEPPTVAGVFFAWATDGMDPASEKYLRATGPAPVVAIFSKLLGRRYHREIAPVWRAS